MADSCSGHNDFLCVALRLIFHWSKIRKSTPRSVFGKGKEKGNVLLLAVTKLRDLEAIVLDAIQQKNCNLTVKVCSQIT